MSSPNFAAFVQALNNSIPNISNPSNTSVSSSLTIRFRSHPRIIPTLFGSIVVHQTWSPHPIFGSIVVHHWEVSISVNQGGMIYDYKVPFSDDQQIAKESINLLKNHGV
jgi:hypothetical protein